ncbi:hypothetical protein DSO57_1039216 [Entomophthora muscae]|uniref:Uncharacterized protein n=1 Tax=Entomophthora muscae TaxID=34485 RepID=A0ACC2U7H3_9FUNG|nr:hypothetical protein DSO57_1039216 [Entomophthora muscae]
MRQATELIHSLDNLSRRLVFNSKKPEAVTSTEQEGSSDFSSLKESTVLELDYVFKISKKIKLLVDIPEQIWNALEGFRFLEASKLCLFAEETYEELTSSTISSCLTPVLKVFPVISSQWDILQNVRASVSYKARKMLQSVAFNPEEFFKCLVAIFYIDGLSLIDTINVFLESREQAIWRIFSETSEASDFHSAAEFLQQIIYIVHATMRGTLHFFIINGAVFFSEDSFTALKRKLPRSFSTSNYPLFSIRLNWSEISLFLNEACTDVIDFRVLDAPPKRTSDTGVSLVDINAVVESWFRSLCDSMQPKIDLVLKQLSTPSLASQVHHFLGQLLDDLHVPSLMDTEFSGLFSRLGTRMWQHVFHSCLLKSTSDAFKSIISQNYGFQKELKHDLINANSHIPQDFSASLWDIEPASTRHLKQQLSSQLSGHAPFITSVYQKVMASSNELCAAYCSILSGPRSYPLFEFCSSAQESYISFLEEWCSFIENILEEQIDHRNKMQLGKLLLLFKKFTEELQSEDHWLREYSFSEESRLQVLDECIYTLSSASYKDWYIQTSSTVKQRLTAEWLGTFEWIIAQEVPAHFIQDSSVGLGYLPSQATSSLVDILFDLNDIIFSGLGATIQKDVVQNLCHQIWLGVWPELSDLLQKWSFDSPTVSVLQGMFDMQFLYLLLIGSDNTNEFLSPVMYIGERANESMKDNIKSEVAKYYTTTVGLLGSIASDTMPNSARDLAKASPFHNVLAMAAPWQRFRLID